MVAGTDIFLQGKHSVDYASLLKKFLDISPSLPHKTIFYCSIHENDFLIFMKITLYLDFRSIFYFRGVKCFERN